MIPRNALAALLAVFVILVVAFAVLMGGYGITAAMGDGTGARVLGWLAVACLIFLAIDCLLLLAALTLIQLAQWAANPSHDENGPSSTPSAMAGHDPGDSNHPEATSDGEHPSTLTPSRGVETELGPDPPSAHRI